MSYYGVIDARGEVSSCLNIKLIYRVIYIIYIGHIVRLPVNRSQLLNNFEIDRFVLWLIFWYTKWQLNGLKVLNITHNKMYLFACFSNCWTLSHGPTHPSTSRNWTPPAHTQAQTKTTFFKSFFYASQYANKYWPNYIIYASFLLKTCR